MDPTIWGPKAWFFLHSVTLAYPENPSPADQNNIYHFFMSLKNSLPCKACNDHYAAYVGNGKSLRAATRDRKDMIKWLIMLHNKINIINNKKQWSVQEVMEKYKSEYRTEAKRCWSFSFMYENYPNVFFALFLLLIFALIKFISSSRQ